MKVKMLNQIYNQAKSKTTKYERRKNFDKKRWQSTYVSNLPMEILTDDAFAFIQNFVYNQFSDVLDIVIERNCMVGFWQFTVITSSEITDYEISDNMSYNTVKILLDSANEWYEDVGEKKYPYMSVIGVKPIQDGIIVILKDCYDAINKIKINFHT